MPKKNGLVWARNRNYIQKYFKSFMWVFHMALIVSAFSYMHKCLHKFGFNVSKTIHRAALCIARGQESPSMAFSWNPVIKEMWGSQVQPHHHVWSILLHRLIKSSFIWGILFPVFKYRSFDGSLGVMLIRAVSVMYAGSCQHKHPVK